MLLFGLGLVATFGSSKLEFSGAGPLGCLTLAFVAAFKWRKEDWSAEGGVSLLGILFDNNLISLDSTQVVSVDNVDQNQTAHNVLSDLRRS